ncbi:TPA: type-F conjugative transfer system pilin assembly thiol-disulfide isomerase TrbB [Escherichia coli]
MISKRRFSLPRLDITGMWVFSLGVWFHIVARLVYSKPWMAFFLAELIAAILVLFGAYQVLDAWIARVSREEREALEARQQAMMAEQPAQPAADTSARTEKPAPRWFRLSNDRQVNLADWKVVLFMQGHCPYCHQFDPVLKQLAQQYGFSVFPYTLDGQGDTAFPEALPVPPDVMQTFFPNIPVATPTTFLVNVNTLEALPLLQGATDAAGFMARMDTVLQMYGGKKGAK